MRHAPESLQKLIAHFDALPGIGPKHATRLALHLVNRQDKAKKFSADITAAINNLKLCSECLNITDKGLCAICADTKRSRAIICVVANVQDIDPIERTGVFSGVYHVLHGLVDPLEGVTPDHVKIKELLARASSASEIILALDATSEGEATSLYLTKLLKEKGSNVTKLARGLPIGSSIEYTDEVTLSSALEHRQG